MSIFWKIEAPAPPLLPPSPLTAELQRQPVRRCLARLQAALRQDIPWPQGGTYRHLRPLHSSQRAACEGGASPLSPGGSLADVMK